MTDLKISALIDGGDAAATDRIPVARSPFGSGDNRYLTVADLDAYTVGQHISGPTAVGIGVKTISGVADSSTNFGKYLTFNVNGTNYYVPCSTVPPA